MVHIRIVIVFHVANSLPGITFSFVLFFFLTAIDILSHLGYLQNSVMHNDHRVDSAERTFIIIMCHILYMFIAFALVFLGHTRHVQLQSLKKWANSDKFTLCNDLTY